MAIPFYADINLNGSDAYNIAYLAIGNPSVLSDTRLYVKGASDTPSDYTVRLQNNSGVDYFVARNDGKVGINNAALVYTLNVNGATSTLGWISRGYHHINYGNNDIQPADSRPNITFSNSTDTQVFILGIENDDTFGIFCKGATAYGFEINRVTANVGFSIAPVTNSRVTIFGSDATGANYGLQVRNVSNQPTLYVKNNGYVGVGVDPGYKFHVVSNFATTGQYRIAEFDNGQLTELRVYSSGAASSSYITAENSSGSYVQLQGSTNYSEMYMNSANHQLIMMRVNNVENFRIISNISYAFNAMLTNQPWYLANISNSKIHIYVDNTTSFTGIGGIIGSAMLHVRGNTNDNTAFALRVDRLDNAPLLRVRNDGVVLMENLPVSSAGLPAGSLWNNGGVVNIV